MAKMMISRFKELPKTKRPWWALGMAACAFLVILLIQYMYVIWPSFGYGGYAINPVFIVFIMLILAIASIVLDCLALKKGERSWVVWLGFVPAIYVAATWGIRFMMLVTGMFGG